MPGLVLWNVSESPLFDLALSLCVLVACISLSIFVSLFSDLLGF